MPVTSAHRGTLRERLYPGVLLAAGCILTCPSHRLSAQELAELPSAPLPQPGTYALQAPQPGQTAGSVSGLVVDPHHALIPNAQISLTSAGEASPRAATSAGDGRFQLDGVPPGRFQLTVQASGFQAVTSEGTLLPGQSFVLDPVVLPVATVAVQVDAITEEEAAALELHQEEHQRLLGALPNFFVSYRWDAPPLSSRQKYELAWRNASDPGNLALAATLAGVQQAANAFPGYHQGWIGYSKRFGADVANLWAGTFMGGAVLPSLFRQDPRYFYMGTGTRKQRFLHAVGSAVICRGDNGHRQPAIASILGDLSAGAISNLYYPASDRQGALLTFENGLLAIAGDAMNGFVQEFFLHKVTTGANKSVDASTSVR